MSSKYTVGRRSFGFCDRCGFRYKLAQLKKLTIKTQNVNIKVCPECWEADHPQLQLGMYPVQDPQAIEDPRPDTGLLASQDIYWGWNPVGYYNSATGFNATSAYGSAGTVTVSSFFQPIALTNPTAAKVFTTPDGKVLVRGVR